MKIGIVCPYSFAVPGGVQSHVADLAKALLGRGHEVSVLAPATSDDQLPHFVHPAGRAVGVPFNGSVARLQFGPVAYTRVRRWIANNQFDVLHLHEPVVPSLSMLALKAAEGPIVATFHIANPRSRTLRSARPVLRPLFEKITARIAVSELARRMQVEHLGGNAVEIPNGVDVPFYRDGGPLPDYPREGSRIGFVGRFDEPRKGMSVLLDAMRELLPDHPGLRLLLVGAGDADELREQAGAELSVRMDILGQVDDATKAMALRSMDIYCAPNLGGESFGIILAEAMAAGTPVVASALDSFRRVLDDGEAGVLVPSGDAGALATELRSLLGDEQRRARLAAAGSTRVKRYDWATVCDQVLRVYEVAVQAQPRPVGAAVEEEGS